MTHPKTQWRMPTRSKKRVRGGLRPAYWLKLPDRSPLPEWHASSNAASTTGQSHILARTARKRHPEFTAAECLVRNRADRRAWFGARSPNGAQDDSPGQAPSPRGASPWGERPNKKPEAPTGRDIPGDGGRAEPTRQRSDRRAVRFPAGLDQSHGDGQPERTWRLAARQTARTSPWQCGGAGRRR